MKFSNSLIANIARVLQIGILSGTDIVDQLRTFTVEEGDDSTLRLTSESLERIEREIDSMMNDIRKNQENVSGKFVEESI